MQAAVRIALEYRLDLMNVRANLYDAWRQIRFRANALKGIFNIAVNNQIFTPPTTNNPFAFFSQAKQFNLALQTELPLIRVNERNNFRQAIIQYQQARRQLQNQEDFIKNQLRGDLRSMMVTYIQYQINRRNLILNIRLKDQAFEQIVAPPQAGAGTQSLAQSANAATQTSNLINFQSTLITSEIGLTNTYAAYQLARLTVYRDIGTLPYDEWEAFSELFPTQYRGPSLGPGTSIPRPASAPAPKRRRASVGKILALGLAALLALGGIAVVSVPGLSKPIRGLFKSADLDIIPFEVKPVTLPITVNEKGALESSKNQDVQCLVEGSTTIITILPEGTPVKKGDVVCELDSASLKDQLTNQKIATQGAEASYQNARLTREVAQIAVKEYKEGIYLQDKATIQGEIKLADSDLVRAADRVDWATRMYEKGYVSKAQKVSEELNLQKAKFTFEQSQSKLEVLEKYTKAKTIKELESEVEKSLSDELAKKQTYQLERDKEAKLEKQIANCKLLAPGDGIVVYANDPMKSFGSNQPQIEEGATVRERQKIFSLPDITKMQVNAKVHESQIDKIQRGLKAKIRVDAFADRELSGTVMDVAPLPDATNFFSSDIKVYTTRIRIDDPLPGLRPGMNAEVEILVDRKDKILAVPIQAILEYQGKDHVAARTPNGYERRVVEVGVNNERFVEVTKGVTAGTVVALNPVSLMTDEERREFQGSKGANKKDWGGLAKGKDEAGAPGAEGAKASPIAGAVAGKGPAAAPGKPGDPAAKGKAKAKARAKGAGGGGAFMAKFKNIPEEDRARLKTASPEERAEHHEEGRLHRRGTGADEAVPWRWRWRRWWRGGGGGGRGAGGPPGGGN